MVSRNSARSATLRAIGPCTDIGENKLLLVPRVTRPGEGRMPTTEDRVKFGEGLIGVMADAVLE